MLGERTPLRVRTCRCSVCVLVLARHSVSKSSKQRVLATRNAFSAQRRQRVLRERMCCAPVGVQVSTVCSALLPIRYHARRKPVQARRQGFHRFLPPFFSAPYAQRSSIVSSPLHMSALTVRSPQPRSSSLRLRRSALRCPVVLRILHVSSSFLLPSHFEHLLVLFSLLFPLPLTRLPPTLSARRSSLPGFSFSIALSST